MGGHCYIGFLSHHGTLAYGEKYEKIHTYICGTLLNVSRSALLVTAIPRWCHGRSLWLFRTWSILELELTVGTSDLFEVYADMPRLMEFFRQLRAAAR